MSSSNRLLKDFGELKKGNDGSFVLYPFEKNINKWKGKLKGPSGTPYQEGFFDVVCEISNSYPLNPPEIKFVTKIFHPNIHPETGEICLDILKNAWTPAWTLVYVFQAILVLLSNPEPNSPLNCDAGNLLRNKDYRGFSSLAYMYSI
ncbi:ubiquitin-conjugating enzyme E2-21 KD (nucleomorph) [Chroomonas mesostigmatica CCMP1168]|uniref:Ubiquitin-conjugating enzyme E2-21 KD n=1 Tax=Chroomonas mesostigmatica CCMP1168 TaxID=1195612 RepID=J7GA75_9CRYP|nr:ubiquitin-conjugating enzyme E2-21 KD [Chroomonas mesostigmatica CCMP1168]|mmetsp:Transcript_67052/g.165385  ORF Transcript_67052/g.165385 Transcript_67052/m.165385 type:complete len:147 (-) Transcript_67052:523-963(-)